MINRKSSARNFETLRLTLASALLLWPLVASQGLLAQPLQYDQTMAQSRILEEQGEPAQAASLLENLLPDYPQDFLLRIRLAWLHFQAKSYPKAEEHYQEALALSPGNVDATLGLAWSRFYLGKRRDAQEGFALVLETVPDNPSARDGLAALEDVPRLTTGISATSLFYHDSPERKGALGAGLLANYLHPSKWSGALSYRFSHHEYKGSTGAPRGWGKRGFYQHEAMLNGGLERPAGNLLAHYGYVWNDSGALDRVHVAGISGKLISWGTTATEASLSSYEDQEVWRSRIAHSLPLGAGVSLTPGLAAQYGDDQFWYNAALAVAGHWQGLSLEGGFSYGEEYRPTYLDTSVVYNVAERMRWSAWGSIGVAFSRSLWLTALYEYRAFDTLGTRQSLPGGMHALVVMLAHKFFFDE